VTKRSVSPHFFATAALIKRTAVSSSFGVRTPPEGLERGRRAPVNRLYGGALGAAALTLGLALSGCSSDDSGDDPNPATGGNASATGGTQNASGGASSSGGSSAGGNTGALAYRPCDEGKRYGGFEVSLKNGAVQGQVLNGVVPSYVPEELGAQGECRLLQGKNLFCDPACGSSESCNDDGTCRPTPLGQDVGTVTVTGARTSTGETEIVLAPTASHFYSTRATLAEPPFEARAPLTLTATGSALVPAFSLRGEGVEKLSVPDDPIVVQAGMPLALRWAAPAGATAAKVEINVQFNLHGSSTAAYIDCDVADDGSFDVPKELIDDLLGRELSGFPTVVLTRKTADSLAVGSGCLDFAVTSQVSRALEVPGISSCNVDEDCEPGQVCLHPQLVCE
jgi:hypothetical protein